MDFSHKLFKQKIAHKKAEKTFGYIKFNPCKCGAVPIDFKQTLEGIYYVQCPKCEHRSVASHYMMLAAADWNKHGDHSPSSSENSDLTISRYSD